MRLLACLVCSLAFAIPVYAAVTLAVDKQSGPVVTERAGQLAGMLGRGLREQVNVVVLADGAEVEAWLNRYATAEMALVESAYVSARPGRFVTIGPVGRDLILIGRQGIAGDLPQRAAGILSVTAVQAAAPAATTTVSRGSSGGRQAAGEPARSSMGSSPSKSMNEDRYFVTYVYRERLNREPDADHLEFWTRQLQNGIVTKQQLFELTCNLEKKICNNSQLN